MASRREFLTNLTKPINKEKAPQKVRPPYGLDESIFQNECIKCEDKACVASCDEQIISIDTDGTPFIKFNKNGCTFCDECAIACDMGVLDLANTHTSENLNVQFIISLESCVAHHGVICFSCKEPCIDNAILFNGMFNPVIDSDKCTGCGFCISRCPTRAIEYIIKPLPQKEEIS